jgi:hypothetical protein
MIQRRKGTMERTPVQIASMNSSLIVLCDDGTMWEGYSEITSSEAKMTWNQIAPIPQDWEGDEE